MGCSNCSRKNVEISSNVNREENDKVFDTNKKGSKVINRIMVDNTPKEKEDFFIIKSNKKETNGIGKKNKKKKF